MGEGMNATVRANRPAGPSVGLVAGLYGPSPRTGGSLRFGNEPFGIPSRPFIEQQGAFRSVGSLLRHETKRRVYMVVEGDEMRELRSIEIDFEKGRVTRHDAAWRILCNLDDNRQ